MGKTIRQYVGELLKKHGDDALADSAAFNNSLGGHGAVARALGSRMPLSDWPAKVDQLTKVGRYHLLRFSKSVGSDDGHAVAFHIAVAPRFIDANSCDFQFTSVAGLRAFFKDYWLVYKDWGGTYRLDRYKT